ncbi:MAG: YCF48-related protein [Sinobacteraceae bacterium]|nr:YCF48-related protein [Nevskiaceae bacterium]
MRHNKHKAACRVFRWSICAALMVALLSACSHQAGNQATIAAEKAKPVHRTDQFVATAATPDRVAAGTIKGVLVGSTDDGKSWTRTELPQPASIVGMAACPDGTLAALGFYRKLWVADGNKWQPRPIATKMNPVAITCDASNKLWVVGSRTTVASSADHGKTWQTQKLGKDAILSSVQFLDPQHGIAVGELGTVAITSDGGANWTLSEPLPQHFYPYTVYFADLQHGWVSGVAGALYVTTDGGQNWQEVHNPVKAPIFALAGSGDSVYGVGADGKVIAWRGGQWTELQPKGLSSSELTAITLLPSGGELAVGGNELHKLNLSNNGAQGGLS